MFRDAGRVLAPGVLAHDDELVPGQVGKRVVRTTHPSQTSSGRDQELVARAVPEAVVDLFEPVEVDEQHRHRVAGALAAREGVLQPVEQEHPVRQSGKGVMQRLVAHLVLDATSPQRPGEDVADGVQELLLDRLKLVARGESHGEGPRLTHGVVQGDDGRDVVLVLGAAGRHHCARLHPECFRDDDCRTGEEEVGVRFGQRLRADPGEGSLAGRAALEHHSHLALLFELAACDLALLLPALGGHDV